MLGKNYSRVGYLSVLWVFVVMAVPANAANKRAHLFRIVSEGYAPLAKKFTSFDIGVSDACELLSPRVGTKAAKKPWAPADLYNTATTEAEKPADPALVGEKDIFYVGDDKNRSGSNVAWDWTLQPDPKLTNSMEFSDKKVEKNEFTTYLTFTRKGISYETVARVRTKGPTDCDPQAYICDPASLQKETKSCKDGGWKKLEKVIVVVDVKGALSDSVKPPASDKERNDVKALKLLLREVDGDGAPKGDAYEKTVAVK